jgi:hypothetical protein
MKPNAPDASGVFLARARAVPLTPMGYSPEFNAMPSARPVSQSSARARRSLCARCSASSKCGSGGAMTSNLTGRATARRNVAERIDRFLNGLQSARRLPNRRELFWRREALVNLQEREYPTGEEAMDKAERMMPIPEHAANDLSTNAGATVEQLRAQLDSIMKAEGQSAHRSPAVQPPSLLYPPR